MTLVPTQVIVAFGSNIGDRARAIEQAHNILARRGVTWEAKSGLYESSPYGVADQPDYLNAVSVGSIPLPGDERGAREFLARLKEVEIEMGRVPRPRFRVW